MRSNAFARTGAMVLIAACLGLSWAATAAAMPFHFVFPDQFKQPPTTSFCQQNFGISCYQPAQFQQAYDLNPLYRQGLNGAGRTIVLVDSYGSPTIQGDLATFDQETGLPAPPSFNIIHPAGTPPAYDPTNYDMGGWAFETTLDVEYAHAMAPGANILLVETPTDETLGVQGFPEMIRAENYVIDHGLGDVISQSFGATEQTFPSPQSIYELRSAYYNAYFHGVSVLSAAGDGGASDDAAYDPQNGAVNFYPFRVNSWPSSDPLVTSVGGTQLHLDSAGNRLSPDNNWNDSALFGSPASGGGGVSAVFSRPDYQDRESRLAGDARGTPDISMSAAVDGGAVVYLSAVNSAYGLPGPRWYVVGGTSEATPLMAGIVAIADQAAGHRLGLLNPRLYGESRNPRSGIVDITTAAPNTATPAPGNNTVTFTQQYPGAPYYDTLTHTVQGYNTLPGYDFTTGLGTIDGKAFVEQMARRGFERDRR
jgi:subtilase family serine protease